MTNKLEISRELADRILNELSQCSVRNELRALLAAPVVERQEPVAWTNGLAPCPLCGAEAESCGYADSDQTFVQCTDCGCSVDVGKERYEIWNERTEQPAPVAVVPEGFMLVERSIWSEEQVEAATKCIAMLKNVPDMTDRDLAMAAMDAGQCKAPDITLADFARLDKVKELNP